MCVGGSNARVHRLCRSNCKQAAYLTLAGACLGLGLFITAQGLRETLTGDVVDSGLGHLWPLGPIFVLVGVVVAIAALLMRRRAVDMESQKAESGRENGDVLEKEEPPEKQAVFFEPIIIL